MRIIVEIKIIHSHLEFFFCLVSVSANGVFASASRTAPELRPIVLNMCWLTTTATAYIFNTIGLSSGAVRLAEANTQFAEFPETRQKEDSR